MSRKLPVPITKEEFEKLNEFLKSERDKYYQPRLKKYKPTGLKALHYQIAIILGYGAGFRISEVTGLQKTQKYTYQKKTDTTTITREIYTKIDPLQPEQVEDRHIRIIGGKGQKDRVVPIPTALFRKAGITRKDFKDALPLQITYRGLQDFFKRMCKHVLKKNMHFHMLRHGFATTLLDSGMPMHEVMILTGHSRADTLMIYAHANPTKVLERYNEVEW